MVEDKNPQLNPQNAWEKFSKNLPEDLRLKLDEMTDFEFIEWAKDNQEAFPEARFPHILLDARFELRYMPKQTTEEKPEKEPGAEKPNRRRHQERELIEEEEKKQEKEAPLEPEAKESTDTALEQPKAETDWVRNQYRPQIDSETKRVLKKSPTTSTLSPKPTQITSTPRRLALRSRVLSFASGRQQSVSSFSIRLARNSVVRPLSKTPGIISKTLFKGGSKAIARTGIMASRILAQLTALAVAVLSIKIIVIGLLVLIFVLILLILINLILGGPMLPTAPNISEPIESPYPGISYSVTPLDSTARINSEYKHIVKLAYTEDATCSIDQITLVDLIPPETTLVDSKTTGTFTKKGSERGDEVRWKLHPDNIPLDETGAGKLYVFEVVFITNKPIDAQNRIYIEGCGNPIIPELKTITQSYLTEIQQGLFEGADSLPSNDTCNKYGGIMDEIKDNYPDMNGTNFGDPLCNYSDAKFRQVLEQTEKNADNIPFWLDIVSCESRSPNGFGMNSKGGTWGRFQMRASYSNQVPNPGKKWTELNDRGDVPWQRQIQNAVFWNSERAKEGDNFIYWESAYCLCSTARHKDKPYCDDIKRQGKAKTCSICR